MAGIGEGQFIALADIIISEGIEGLLQGRLGIDIGRDFNVTLAQGKPGKGILWGQFCGGGKALHGLAQHRFVAIAAKLSVNHAKVKPFTRGASRFSEATAEGGGGTGEIALTLENAAGEKTEFRRDVSAGHADTTLNEVTGLG